MKDLPPPPQDTIDRAAPTRRPVDRVVMRQIWHHLLFLHWPIPTEQLRPLIPAELEIDTYQGQAFVGLVPFTMTGVRPVWSPSIPLLSNFHETNVRTYVHRGGADPGVWFFSLDAANAIAVRVARTFFRLPYFYARMRLDLAGSNNATAGNPGDGRVAPGIGTIDYRTERLWPDPVPATCSVTYCPVGFGTPSPLGSLEHFLIERYILYTAHRDRLYSGRVHHLSYPAQKANVRSLQETMLVSAGITRGDEEPLAHYARRVDVDIFPLHDITAP